MSAGSFAGKHRQALLEVLRYGAVAVLGLGVDVGIGYAAHRYLGLPLIVGAAAGFLTGVAVNYILFEVWVFRSGRMSWARLGKAYVAAQGALLVRLACVWLLGHWLAGMAQAALMTLVGAAGISFVVNFVLVRLFLKSQKPGLVDRGVG